MQVRPSSSAFISVLTSSKLLKNIPQSSEPSMILLAHSSKVLSQSSFKHGRICHSKVEEDTKVNGIERNNFSQIHRRKFYIWATPQCAREWSTTYRGPGKKLNTTWNTENRKCTEHRKDIEWCKTEKLSAIKSKAHYNNIAPNFSMEILKHKRIWANVLQVVKHHKF